MLKKFSLILLLSIVKAIHIQKLLHLDGCNQVVYDHHVLSLFWPGALCSQNTCVDNWKEMWDSTSLTIHGLWPSSVDLSYLKCYLTYGYDPHCAIQYDYKLENFTNFQLTQLKQYWPQLGAVKDLWEHEWQKHGSCYMSILKKKFNSKLTEKQIFHKFFMSTIQKAKKLDIKLKPGEIKTEGQLQKLIGLQASQFYCICGPENSLQQVRICFNEIGEAGQQVIIDCPYKNEGSTQCKFPIIIL